MPEMNARRMTSSNFVGCSTSGSCWHRALATHQSVRPATACREGWPLTAFYMFCGTTRPADALAG
jgi:hypothetical protein